MTASYDQIFSRFLSNITDYDFLSLNMDDAYMKMTEYLHMTISQPYVRRLFSVATLDDEIQQFTFEMEFPDNESADFDFVMYILSKGLVVEWLNPQVQSKLMTAQMIASNKETKFFSQSSHLGQLQLLLENAKLAQRNAIRDRGYINNTYLEGR